MKNEEQLKQVWQTPEIIDLDVENTASGDVYSIEMDTTCGPS